jgi:DNA-binding MarR family transcriptional regulator
MAGMNANVPWLSEKEQHLWRRWLRVNALLPATLHRELQAQSGLSLPDFEVLVQLTDSPDDRVRVSDLARALHWERSRVSHHVTRMERRGLVKREECLDDGRGAFVVLTTDGRAAIDQAAPCHVRTVRRIVFDPLTGDDADALAGVLDKVLARLDAVPDPDPA